MYIYIYFHSWQTDKTFAAGANGRVFMYKYDLSKQTRVPPGEA